MRWGQPWYLLDCPGEPWQTHCALLHARHNSFPISLYTFQIIFFWPQVFAFPILNFNSCIFHPEFYTLLHIHFHVFLSSQFRPYRVTSGPSTYLIHGKLKTSSRRKTWWNFTLFKVYAFLFVLTEIQKLQYPLTETPRIISLSFKNNSILIKAVQPLQFFPKCLKFSWYSPSDNPLTNNNSVGSYFYEETVFVDYLWFMVHQLIISLLGISRILALEMAGFNFYSFWQCFTQTFFCNKLSSLQPLVL